MKADNAFDKHLEINKGIPEEVRSSAVYVNDTLNVAWLSAQAIFEDKATPELAIEIYDLIQQKIGE